MKLIHVIGCCLLLVIVVAPSEGGWFKNGKKSENSDKKVPVGLVKEKKTPQPIKEDSKLEKNDQDKTKTDTGASKQDSELNQPKAETALVKVDDPSTSTPGKDTQATQDSQLTPAEEIQKKVDKTQEVVKELKKINSLEKDLAHAKNKDESSVDDIIEDLIAISRKRTKIKAALLIYSIINLILYIAQYAGGFITPPVGRALYFLDIFAKNILRKPLDDYYAEYQKASASAVARYVQAHPDEFKNLKVGKNVSIKNPKVKFNSKLLKLHPSEELTDKDLRFVDQNPFTALNTWYNARR